MIIEDTKLYCVKELSADSGLARDTIVRRIKGKLIRAFRLPCVTKSRKRTYETYRVLGRDWRRFIEGNTN